MSRIATKLVWADSPFNAEQMPVRHGQKAHPCAEKSQNFDLKNKCSIYLRTIENHANSPAGGKDANSATSFDFAIDTPFNGAIKAQRSWTDSSKDVTPASGDGFTVVHGKRRRRSSAESLVTAAHSSNASRSGFYRRQRSSTERVPRAQEIKTTRTHIVEARARQASSTEEQCLYVEHCPEFEPYHYLKAIDEMVGGTSDVVQVTKMNGHYLLGLANKALAERLINEGLEVKGMLLRTFPFYIRAAKITIGNLPFFVKDASVIDALLPYGRVTSIVPKQLKAGKYVYTDGRREAFIVPHDGMTIESIPTRLDIRMKGEAWPMYLTSGIRCSRCRGQGHRRANCPLLTGQFTGPRRASPSSTTNVSQVTAPELPRQASAASPSPPPPDPAMEVSGVLLAASAASLRPAVPGQPPPAPMALPIDTSTPAPAPPAPSRKKLSNGPTAHTAPQLAEPTPPTPHREESTQDIVTPTFPLFAPLTQEEKEQEELESACEAHIYSLLEKLNWEQALRPLFENELEEIDISFAFIWPKWRERLLTSLSRRHKPILAEFLGTVAEHARDCHPIIQMSRMATSFIRAESPSKAVQKPVRHSVQAQTCAELSAKEDLQRKISNNLSAKQNYANPPTGVKDANLAAARGDVTTGLAAATSSNGAARVLGNWADYTEDQGPGEDDNFTVVKSKKRRRDSPGSPTAATSSGTRGAGATRRPRSSTGWAPRAEEVRTTQAHIAEARARQASSTEDYCVYVERSPELEPYHYIRAIDRMFGSTREVFQVTKMNGHFLVGLANRGMAERLVNEGLGVEGTLHRAFPFRKRAERITVGNLPFFVGDAAVISALSSFGRVTSIASKLMKAGPYIYNDGRREAFIIFREGMTIERLPTRLDITIKGEAWPAYLSSGIRCSRCRGKGHRRANCPLLAGLANNTRLAPPTTPAAVPSTTTSAPPQRSAAQPPTPASSSPARETPGTSPAARAVTTSTAPRPSPPVAPAVPMEEAPSTPPPVTPAPSLQAPGGPAQRTLGSAAPTPDVEMSIAEETSASSTSAAKNATRVDLDAFIEKHPSVSFAGTDVLGLGREEVLDLLSSRTKAQRKGPLLSPPQCDALAGLIGQILDLRPGASSNLYKVLGQVKAELRTTPAVPPTPPLPAPRPAETAPPAPQGEESAPAEVAYPPPLPVKMTDETRKKWLLDLFKELNYKTFLATLLGWTRPEQIIHAALHSGEKRKDILNTHPNQRSILANFLGSVIERARGAGSPHRAEHEPARLGSESEAVADLSAENHFQGEDSRMADASANYANLPIDRSHAYFAAACIADVTPSTSGALAAATNWAEQMEAAESGEDSFTVVKHKRRRRESPNRPVEQRSSGVAASRRTGATPRRRPTAGGATVVQEIRATRADIADARVQQRSSTEDNCVFVEHCPDFGYTHYLQAVEELVGGAGNVLQVMKMDGHMLVGLSTKALAERLLRDGLEIGHTHLRAFPFKKRAERITVANLPFFVDDAAVIEALRPYGDVTSIVPIRLKAGRYTFTDGRREVFILLKEGFTLEKIPTRVVIRNKGNVLSVFISYGVKCSRCGRQGHRRANCPINPGRASNNGQPQPAPLPLGASSTVSRQQSRPTPAAPALPMEETPSAPPPVTPAPPLQAPEGPVGPRPAGSQHPEPPPARPDLVAPRGPLPAQKTLGPAAPTPDVEMSIVEETLASSTSSAKNATRIDLDAFIERHPSVSFAETDALGLGREEVLDLLSSRTKAQRSVPLLPPPQCDALAGIIRQILDLRPGAASNLYKVLGQVKAELRTTPAAVPTPPPPAPRPAEPAPPAPHGEKTTPDMATPPPPLSPRFIDERWKEAHDIIDALGREPYSEHLSELRLSEGDITDAIICPEDREPLLRRLSTRRKNLLAEIISAAVERARDIHPFAQMASLSCMSQLQYGKRSQMAASVERHTAELRIERHNVISELNIRANVRPRLNVRHNATPGLNITLNVAPGMNVGLHVNLGLNIRLNVAPGIIVRLNVSPGLNIRLHVIPELNIRANVRPGLNIRHNATLRLIVWLHDTPVLNVGLHVAPELNVGLHVAPELN
ncbi:hypothetical protein LAZ67_3001849, partial [Cordylochernes scorpioides]